MESFWSQFDKEKVFQVAKIVKKEEDLLKKKEKRKQSNNLWSSKLFYRNYIQMTRIQMIKWKYKASKIIRSHYPTVFINKDLTREERVEEKKLKREI